MVAPWSSGRCSPNTPLPSSLSSPVAILVGARVSTQVEDEKALRELVCAAERMREGLMPALFPSRGRERSKITGSVEPRGGRAPHGTIP